MNMPWKNPPPVLSPMAGAGTLAKAVAEVMAPPINSNYASLIDELGALRSQIKTLEKREKELTGLVEAIGIGEHDGTKCRAVVSQVVTNRLDTKSLTAVLPEELVKAHTKPSVSTRVAIKALV